MKKKGEKMLSEKQIIQAKYLLSKLGKLKPTQLKDWNIKAQTFLTFALIGELNENLRNNLRKSAKSADRSK